MSTVPRVDSAVAGEAPNLRNVLLHQPVLAERFGALYAHFWGGGSLNARVKEIARMRNARVTECGFCRNVRFDAALRDGLTEADVDDITNDYPASRRLSAAEKAALRFTDAIIHDPAAMDAESIAELKRHFTPQQIAELGTGVTIFLAMAKTLITLGLEPDAMGRTELPTPSARRYAEAAAA